MAALLAACGSPSPPAPVEPAAAEPPDPAPADEPTDEPAGDDEVPTTGLSIRIDLLHPEMPANGDPSVDLEARLDATLVLVNGEPSPRTVTAPIPSAHELDWIVEAEDGTRWRPTFLPPPVPRPGGPPTATVTVPAGGEARFCDLHGISGFRREDQATADRRPALPRGRYRVTVSGFALGDERLAAPPVALRVR